MSLLIPVPRLIYFHLVIYLTPMAAAEEYSPLVNFAPKHPFVLRDRGDIFFSPVHDRITMKVVFYNSSIILFVIIFNQV